MPDCNFGGMSQQRYLSEQIIWNLSFFFQTVCCIEKAVKAKVKRPKYVL
jgi:hypothetical protein